MLHLTAASLPSRRSVFDMFNFLASKHRQLPQYRPLEEDDDEGQLRTARSVVSGFFFFCSCNVSLPSLAKQSVTVSEQKRLFSHFSISCCRCRRASMELPLAVRFKQLKATSRETVGVYRLELG